MTRSNIKIYLHEAYNVYWKRELKKQKIVSIIEE